MADQQKTVLPDKAKVCAFGVTEPHTCYELMDLNDIWFINTIEFRNRADVSLALSRFLESGGEYDSNGRVLIDTILRAAFSVYPKGAERTI